MTMNTQSKTEWTNKRLLEWTADYLGKAEVEQARLCAELLLAHVLNWQRIRLYTDFDYQPSAEQLAEFRGLVKRCVQHEPVAYLTGHAHFYSMDLEVNASVLIPRPETEVLVTHALDYLRQQTSRPTAYVLDLCTGSGCIAIALAANVVEADILAIDSSGEALEVARRNVEKYDLQGRVHLLEGDLFATMEQAPCAVFDLIVSNPPYIAAAEFDKLESNVRNYEPRGALLAGADGLDYYRRIAGEAGEYLADGGVLMVEVGYNQAREVAGLLEQTGTFKDITVYKDHLGHGRVVKAAKA